MKTVTFLLAAVSALALPAAANAQTAPNGALTISFMQSGANVVETASGFFNVTGLSPNNFGITSDVVAGAAAYTVVGTPGGTYAYYQGLSGPTSFGSGGNIFGSSGTGPLVGLQGNANTFYAPVGYVSGIVISSSLTYLSTTIASLGLTPGTYNYTSSQNAITVQIGPVAAAALPEPATWAMMIGGFGTVEFAMRRRRATTRVLLAG